MAAHFRKRRSLHWPIALSAALMALNVTLMVCWIILLARHQVWNALTIGTVAFALVLVGLSLYTFLSIKEVRLHQRQVNFVDSVTHELKSPLAALRLYLETLQMRSLEESRRDEFYRVMEAELRRLDRLINQLLEVGRLDAVGHGTEPEDVLLEPLLRRCAETTMALHNPASENVFQFRCQPAVIHARRLVLEMIFGNLLDNAVKYGGTEPQVEVEVRPAASGRVLVRIADNGEGVPSQLRKRIFKMFYRGGSELERRQKGTGLGLYIVRTLVQMLKGSISVSSRSTEPGSVFEVELPGQIVDSPETEESAPVPLLSPAAPSEAASDSRSAQWPVSRDSVS